MCLCWVCSLFSLVLNIGDDSLLLCIFVPLALLCTACFGCVVAASGMSVRRGLDLRLRRVQRRAAAGALKVACLREEGVVLAGTPRFRDLHNLELQASSLEAWGSQFVLQLGLLHRDGTNG